MFKQAIKFDAKLRLALCGPAGSGKTYTLLTLATELAGPDGKIAFVDTEHGSASKYADLFRFDVIEPDMFDPRDLIVAIGEAAKAGYKVICVDSLSHYWMGVGGELDLVDNTAKQQQARSGREGNSFTAWKTVTPIHNNLIDTIIGAPIHVMVSMRTKTEWVLEKDDRGKQVPKKVGMAPIMRDGIEFEFDVCGDMDQDNNLVVTKSRCPDLSGKVINRPGKKMAESLRKWLSGAVPVAPPAAVAQPAAVAPKAAATARPASAPPPPPPPDPSDDDIPASMGGTWVDPQTAPSATAHLEAARKPAAVVDQGVKPWTTFAQMVAVVEAMRPVVGDKAYFGELDLYGIKDPRGFSKTKNKGDDALACYQGMQAKAPDTVAA